MSPVGVVVALPSEARSLARGGISPGETVRLAGGARLRACGIGLLRARLGARGLLRHGATALLSWGTAGGIEPGVKPGTVLVPEAVAGPGGSLFCADPGWRERVLEALGGFPVHSGLLATSRVAVVSRGEKGLLRQGAGVSAVDMESSAVAAAALEAGARFLVVRAVADPAEGEIPGCALAAVDAEGRLQAGRLLAALRRRPDELLGLLRLAAWYRAAQRSLAQVARRAGLELVTG